jgi:hypothetical protein
MEGTHPFYNYPWWLCSVIDLVLDHSRSYTNNENQNQSSHASQKLIQWKQCPANTLRYVQREDFRVGLEKHLDQTETACAISARTVVAQTMSFPISERQLKPHHIGQNHYRLS